MIGTGISNHSHWFMWDIITQPYLMVPSHYLNQCWLLISRVLWHSPEVNMNVIRWKHFPCYWPFVRGIHRSPVNFPSQRPVVQSFDAFFDLCPNKRLSTQSRCWWFEMPSHLLWCHCNEDNSTGNAADIHPWYEFKNQLFEVTAASPDPGNNELTHQGL